MTATDTKQKKQNVKRKRIVRIVSVATGVLSVVALVSCCYWMWNAVGRGNRAEPLPQLPVQETSYHTLTPLPTFTPSPVPTIAPTIIPTPLPYVCADGGGINVRSGPGLEYTAIGTLDTDETAAITGYHGKWWRIDYEGGDGWVATWVVSSHNTYSIPAVPVGVEKSEEPTALPPSTIASTPTEIVLVSTEEVCECSGNVYNCDDFATQQQAQRCFDFCKAGTGTDVHLLDSDADGIACESLP